jgi:hypothetical protein
METLTTIILIVITFFFSIGLITRGARGMKKSIKELKEGKN